MPDLYIDEDTGDIYISATGQARLTQTLQEEVRQRLDTKYRFFLGEWFLDARQGIPYFRDVFVKAPDLAVIRSLLTRVAAEDPGVDAVTSFDMSIDGRTLSVQLECVLTDGTVLPLNLSEFIL
jgi:hypothetical protein